jgi:hypothetical protein
MPTFPPGAAALGTHAAAVANKQARRVFDAEVLPEIEHLLRQGPSHRAIAQDLEYPGFATRRGGSWDGTTVRRILERAKAGTTPADAVGQHGVGQCPAEGATVPDGMEHQARNKAPLTLRQYRIAGATLPELVHRTARTTSRTALRQSRAKLRPYRSRRKARTRSRLLTMMRQYRSG